MMLRWLLFSMLGLTACNNAKAPDRRQESMAPQPPQTLTTKAPSAVTPQDPMHRAFPNAAEKTCSIECFRSFGPLTSMNMIVKKCGRPDEDVGSGLFIFVYHMPDDSAVTIGTADLDGKVGDVIYTDVSGKHSSLLRKKSPGQFDPVSNYHGQNY